MAMTTHTTTLPVRWHSWHLHVSNVEPAAGDEVVRRVVGPAIDGIRDNRPGTAWFFLRYWQGGPHIRLRVADLDDGVADAFEHQLRNAMSPVMASTPETLTADGYQRYAAPLALAGEGGQRLEIGDLRAPGVYRHAYRPEFDRYGGADLLAVSEALFEVASQLTLAFLRRHPPEAARSGLGLQATRAALGVFANDERRRSFCRRASAGWQAWATRAGGPAEAGKYPPPAPARCAEGTIPAPVRRWTDELAVAMQRWRRERAEDQAQRILHSHIHLLHNRLGLGVAHEYRHYRALTASFGAPDMAAVTA